MSWEILGGWFDDKERGLYKKEGGKYDRKDTPWCEGNWQYGKRQKSISGILPNFILEALNAVNRKIGAIRRNSRRKIINNLQEERNQNFKEKEDRIIRYLLDPEMYTINYLLNSKWDIEVNKSNKNLDQTFINKFLIHQYGLWPKKLEEMKEEHNARMKDLNCMTIDEYVFIWRNVINKELKNEKYKSFLKNKKPEDFLKNLAEWVTVKRTRMYGCDGSLVNIVSPEWHKNEYFITDNEVTSKNFERNPDFYENSFSIEELSMLISDIYRYIEEKWIEITPKFIDIVDDYSFEERNMDFNQDLRYRKTGCIWPEGARLVKYLTKLYKCYYTKNKWEDWIPNSHAILFGYMWLGFQSDKWWDSECCLLLKPEKTINNV